MYVYVYALEMSLCFTYKRSPSALPISQLGRPSRAAESSIHAQDQRRSRSDTCLHRLISSAVDERISNTVRVVLEYRARLHYQQ